MTFLLFVLAVVVLILAIRYGFVGILLDIFFAIVTGGSSSGSSGKSGGSGFGGGDSGGSGASSDF